MQLTFQASGSYVAPRGSGVSQPASPRAVTPRASEDPHLQSCCGPSWPHCSLLYKIRGESGLCMLSGYVEEALKAPSSKNSQLRLRPPSICTSCVAGGTRELFVHGGCCEPLRRLLCKLAQRVPSRGSVTASSWLPRWWCAACRCSCPTAQDLCILVSLLVPSLT